MQSTYTQLIFRQIFYDALELCSLLNAHNHPKPELKIAAKKFRVIVGRSAKVIAVPMCGGIDDGWQLFLGCSLRNEKKPDSVGGFPTFPSKELRQQGTRREEGTACCSFSGRERKEEKRGASVLI